MKKISLFILITISLSFFDCKKEEIAVTTVVEGRLTNYITNEPITGATVKLHQPVDDGDGSFWTSGNRVVEDITDQDGKFKIIDNGGPYLWLSGSYELAVAYENRVNINGEPDQTFLYYGKMLAAGQEYYFDIELTPRE